MKYVLMFASTPDLDARIDPSRTQEVYQRIYAWFGEQAEAGVIVDSGAELHPPATATTIRHGDQGPVVVDGPFLEAKEVIGGFSIIEVPDLEAAIAVTRTWPHLELPGVSVEIRPMVEDYSQYE